MQTVQKESERGARVFRRAPESARQFTLLEAEFGLGSEPCGELISDEVTCLDSGLHISKGLALLDATGVTSAPVVDDNGVLVGVVFLTRLAQLREARHLEIEDVMFTDVVTTSHRTTIAEVARLMTRHELERVPVVTPDGHLVGVVTAMDVVRWLAERLP